MSKKTTVVYHSADYDGIFCREIARKFLPDAELIGWDFGDDSLAIPEGKIYILDLPCDAPFGLNYKKAGNSELAPSVIERLVWIDHHKSSIESHPNDVPGYRIDGVAACRLAWQWFMFQALPEHDGDPLPDKQHFVNRQVVEPLAVRLAGEYDIWDKRDFHADLFQFGLDSVSPDWSRLLSTVGGTSDGECDKLCERGEAAKTVIDKRNADVMKTRSFLLQWEGFCFLALNTARCNSLSFAAKDLPETGHDALLGFSWNGLKWAVSMYHAKHRTDLDLSAIAVKHGGGGHRGACGFTCDKLPWLC